MYHIQTRGDGSRIVVHYTGTMWNNSTLKKDYPLFDMHLSLPFLNPGIRPCVQTIIKTPFQTKSPPQVYTFRIHPHAVGQAFELDS